MAHYPLFLSVAFMIVLMIHHPASTPTTTECWLVGRQWSSLRSRLEFSEAVSELSLRVLELPTSGDRAVEVLRWQRARARR